MPLPVVPRASRDKGQRGELEVRTILAEHGFTVHASQRNLGGAQGDTLALGHGVVLHVETKRREQINIWAALTQTTTECAAEARPLLAFRRNHSPWYAAMPLLDLLTVVRRLRCRYCGRVTDGVDVCNECLQVAAADAFGPVKAS